MRKLFSTTLIKLTAMIINLQLFFSPIALAVDFNQPSTSDWERFGGIGAGLTQVAYTAAQAYTQGMQGEAGGPGVGSPDQIEAFKSRLRPLVQVTPINPMEVPLPLRNCAVLPASENPITGNMSCMELDPEKNADDLQKLTMGYGEALGTLADDNLVLLQNFLVDGHARNSSQGATCYSRALEVHKSKYAMMDERLNRFVEDFLKPRINAMKTALAPQLENIKKDSALLTGKPSKYLKDIKFEDALLGKISDPQNICGSVISPTLITRTGNNSNGGGLRGIESAIFEEMNKKPNGAMTADEVLTKAGQITKDINSLSNSIAEQTVRRGNVNVDISSVTFKSKMFDRRNPAINNVVTNFNNQMTQEINTMKDELKLQNIMGDDQEMQSMMSLIENDNNANVSERLVKWERRKKKQCLRDTILSNKEISSIDEFARSFKNPNVSDNFAKEADNTLATVIVSYINNDNVSLDNLVKAIESAEGQSLNSQKTIQLGKTLVLQNGQRIPASARLPASRMFNILRDNCNQQFNNITNADDFSNASKVQALTAFSNEMKRMRKTAASKFVTEMRNELLQCPSDATTGIAALSCSDAMSMSQPNFCVRTAKICAGNFKGCWSKAQGLVKTTRDRQIATAQNYNQVVDQEKNMLLTEMTKAREAIKSIASEIDGGMNMGTVFASPEFTLDTSQLFSFQGTEAEGLDEELRLEDPKAIQEAIIDQVQAYRESIEAHKAQTVALLEAEVKKYEDNYNSQKDYWQRMSDACKDVNRKTDEVRAQQAQTAAQNEQKIAAACQELIMFNENPCDSDIEGVIKSVTEASALASSQTQDVPMTGLTGQNQMLRQMSAIRRQCNSLEDGNNMQPMPADFVTSFCETNSESEACVEFTAQTTGFNQRCANNEIPSITVCQFGSSESAPTYTFKNAGANCGNGTAITATSNPREYSTIIEDNLTVATERTKIYRAARCYLNTPGVRPSSMASVREAAQQAWRNQLRQQVSSMGERAISPAMCNGGFDGMQGGDDPLMGVVNAARRAIGSSGALQQ